MSKKKKGENAKGKERKREAEGKLCENVKKGSKWEL
jgi:hypothetical protein